MRVRTSQLTAKHLGPAEVRRRVRPRIVVFAGLPGTGKSTFARIVARRIGATWLRVDTIEASILKSGIKRSFETGLAAYVAASDQAFENLELGHDVVIDAVNGVEEGRAMWRSLAKKSRAKLTFVEITCSDTREHRRRVETRLVPTPPLPAPSWSEVVHREYLPWKDPVVSIDSVKGCRVGVASILKHLSGSP